MKVEVMRTAFHAELDEVIADLAKMARQTSRMMNDASVALHQRDLALAGLVIADHDQTTAMLQKAEQRCINLLALQAAVTGDQRMVVTALHAVNHLTQMGDLARHVAIIAKCKHPNPILISEIRPVLARMSLLATQLADDTATAIKHPNPLPDDQQAVRNSNMDALRQHLDNILFSENWSHGVQQAVDTALISHCYERFADHAVAIAAQARHLATGHHGPSGSVKAG
jgi:phosphate transport system protein